MSADAWNDLNKAYHLSYQGTDCLEADPNWVARLHMQAEVIADAIDLGLIPSNCPHLDFGCGDGKLSDMMMEKYGLKLGKFDRYNSGKGYLGEQDLHENGFDFVVTTSVFEHLLKRKMLDEINRLVSKQGVLGLHTLVAEEIPENPDWFYLLPVHCAFYTNKSMEILFDEWGYTSSVYQVDAQLWLFFKSNADIIENIVKKANNQSYRKLYYNFKRGFMDYWKMDKHKILSRQIKK